MSSSNFKITTHVLDTSKGLPVCNMSVKLYILKNDNEWILVSEGKTLSSGRFENFIDDYLEFTPGTYKLHFLVKQYYDSIDSKTLYPFIDVTFDIDKAGHYHIPLLLNAFGYTTYRGS
ncbi:PREDICTED: probable 5-hydroxyisourate hydrolase R09H10.3 [Ceratosolen solmsi marchali]|uniref:5-hydroxyisourate hydrolase n=1 Tax=Ceratosolen solmsi marchali TaxID=326594 RepID=A0AAJ7DVJ0_9HYME|nr:PREDICTED: probable 5-hydroxyisourate hydrolase R09H10.3 [Ceratosolen solmsi marchali]